MQPPKKILIQRWIEDDKPFQIVKRIVSKSFSDILKYNDCHDPKTGQFASKNGGSVGVNTNGLSQEQNEKLKGFILQGDMASAQKYREEIGMTMGAYVRFKRQLPKPERKEYVEQNNNRGSQKEHPSGEYQRHERLQQDLGVDSPTAQRLTASVTYFSGNGYKKIRESQRDGKPTDEAKDIEEFIDRSPQWEGGTLYRGVKNGYSDIKIGDNIDMGGTASWSSKKDIAEYCAGVNRGFESDLMIFVSNNIGKATSIRHISNNPNEDEVITSSKNKYTISKIETKSGTKWVYVDEVASTTKSYFSLAKTFYQLIEKFNPYHDRLGRFATAGGASSFTYKPGASVAHDRAIAREKDRIKAANSLITASSGKAYSIASDNGVVTGKREAVRQIKNLYMETAVTGKIAYNPETNKVQISKSHMKHIEDVAKDIMSKQEYQDEAMKEEYNSIHRWIKKNPIKLSDADKGDIADYGDFKRSSFGNLTISNKGMSVDSFYKELSGRYPHLFDENRVSTPSDQLKHINDTLNSLRPKTYRLTGRDLDDASHDFALQIIKGYLASAGVPGAA